MAYNPDNIVHELISDLENIDYSSVEFNASSIPLSTEDISYLKYFIDIAKQYYELANNQPLDKETLTDYRLHLTSAFLLVAQKPQNISCLEKFQQEANPMHLETAINIMCLNASVDSYLKARLDAL